MATHSKLLELLGVAKEGVLCVQWSAMVFFVGGLFWRAICVAKEGVLHIPWSAVVLFVGGLLLRVILVVGQACKFLAEFIEKFDVVARAALFKELREEAPFQELPPPLEAVNVCFVKHEVSSDLGMGDVAAEGGNWAPRVKVEQDPIVRVHHPHLGPGIQNRHVHRELCGEPSAPLDPVEIYIPRFHCQTVDEILCNLPW